MTAEPPPRAITAGSSGVQTNSGGSWEEVDRESLSGEVDERFRGAIEDAAPFDRIVSLLDADHGVGGFAVDDASAWRLGHESGGTRLMLEWSRGNVLLRAFADDAEANQPRLVATVESVEPGGYDGPVAIGRLGAPATIRYYADHSTVVRGDSLRDQVAVGLHVTGSDQLERAAEDVLQDMAHSSVPPEPVLSITTEQPVVGQPVEFSAVGSVPVGPAPIVRYEWIFDVDAVDGALDGPREGAVHEAGDAGQVVYDPLQLRTTHTYQSTGDYEVALIVEDADGNRAMATETVPEVSETAAGPDAVVLEPSISHSLVDEADRRLRFFAEVSPPEGDEVVSYEWYVDGESDDGPRTTHAFGEDGLHRVNLAVETEAGHRGSTTLAFFIGVPEQAPDEQPFEPSVARLTSVEFADDRAQQLSNTELPTGEEYLLPSHGPQVVAPGEQVAFTAKDSILPPVRGEVECVWRVRVLPYGLPSSTITELHEQAIGDRPPPRGHLLGDDTQRNPYTSTNRRYGARLYPLHIEPPTIHEDRLDLDTPFEFTMPSDPSTWTHEFDRREVRWRNPAFMITATLVVSGLPDTAADWSDPDLTVVAAYPFTFVTLTAGTSRVTTTREKMTRTVVHLDLTDAETEPPDPESDDVDIRPVADSDPRWASGRPGVAGYENAGTFQPGDAIVDRSADPVLVPTRSRHVDYLFLDGPQLGHPSAYQTEIEDEVGVQWLAFSPIDWGPPDPEARVFVPVGIR